MQPFCQQASADTIVPRADTRRFSPPSGIGDGDCTQELRHWLTITARAGIPLDQARAIARRAEATGTPLAVELVASGAVSETLLYRELAAELGLPFQERVDPEWLILREREFTALLRRRGGPLVIKAERLEAEVTLLYAPDQLNIPAVRRRVADSPEVARRIRIAPPAMLRQAVLRRAEASMARNASDGLFASFPDLSARIVVCAWQGFLLGAIVLALPVALYSTQRAAGLFIHVFLSLFFLSCVVLRIAAAAEAAPPRLQPLGRFRPEDAPIYSVLVALRDEAAIIPDLFVALGNIVWPRSKLEVKLVCEADDRATLEAIEAHGLRPWVEIIRVPPGEPRTKPKALAYALGMIGGDLVVLYDAEDRPHPLQLIEAWQAFEAGGESLACVQAPLAVSNGGRGWLARMFAFEYAALFRGLLPWLARRELVIPLGGTSNHFRKSALDAICGWDPHNVTEDADLGLRLTRFGYRTETITRPTQEDAPETIRTWLPQRTRWFKGWMQTWLVHMRRPRRLWQELGPASFLVCQILFAGMILSAIIHPVFLATAGYLLVRLVLHNHAGSSQSALILIDIANISLGYLAFLLLGRRTLEKRERRGFWKVIALTPLYWVLMSAAALRAVWKLYVEPHRWEKTPHFRRAGAAGPAAAPRVEQTSAAYDLSRNFGPSPMITGSSSPIAERSRPA